MKPSDVGAFLYRGVVRDNKDPLNLGRVRCVVPELIHGEEDEEVLLDWASPVFPYGSVQSTTSDNSRGTNGFGFFAVPEQDTIVWMTFEAGDLNRPIWVGVAHHVPLDEDGDLTDLTTPSEALDSTDPDTGSDDYPVEKVLKSEVPEVTSVESV